MTQHTPPALATLLVLAGSLLAAGCMSGADAKAMQSAKAHLVSYDLHSKLLGKTLHEVAAVPAGGGTRPLLILLHGRNDHPMSFMKAGLFQGQHDAGDKAPVVVGLDGGGHNYWHDRRLGPWGSMVLKEAIPDAERRFHTSRTLVAIGGESMGGFGALDMAVHHPGEFCAVGGHMPAVWTAAGLTAPGAFDDAADFAKHDLVNIARTQQRPFGSTKVWIDHGDQDPFIPADTAYVAALRADGTHPKVHVWPGTHDNAYVARHLRQYLAFYVHAFATCNHQH
jgi:S-formylglutathione hydrolase FrmB